MIWTATPLKSSDLPALGLFFKKHYTALGLYGNMAHFQWKILENPVMPGLINLVKDDDGKIISTTSVTPKRLLLKGEEYKVAEIGDTYTDPAYQKKGLFALLINHYVEDFCRSKPDGAKLIYGFPNERSLPPYIHRCGFEIFDKLGLAEFERSILRTPSSAMKAALRWMFRTKCQTSSRFCLCTDILKTTAEIDRLWSESQDKEKYLLKKDGTWWQWRYNRATEGYKTYAMREEGSKRFLAYIVVKVRWGRRLRYVQLCDIFGDTSDHAVTAFRHFVQTMVLPIDTFLLWAHPALKLADAAIDEGFVKERDVPVIFFKNQAYERLSESCQSRSNCPWRFRQCMKVCLWTLYKQSRRLRLKLGKKAVCRRWQVFLPRDTFLKNLYETAKTGSKATCGIPDPKNH